MKILITICLFFVGSLASALVFKDANSPCRPLREACMQAGFILNDKSNSDNRLIKNCIIPLSAGQKSVENKMTHKLAQAPADTDVTACKASIQIRNKVSHEGYTVGLKSNHRTNLEPRGAKSAHPASKIIAAGKAKLAAKRAARLAK